MANDVHIKNPLKLDELYSAFKAADNIILKKYITKLSMASCVELAEPLKSIDIGENVALYRVAQIVYDKNENVQDKLTTVYSTIFSLKNCSAVMLINGHKNYVDLFLGVVTRKVVPRKNSKGVFDKFSVSDREVANCGKVLKNTFVGNFPGSELKPVNNIKTSENCKNPVDSMGKKEIIKDSIVDAKYIAAVSSIPAMRNTEKYQNQEFVQSLEKLIDTLSGKEYSVFIIADAMSNDKVEEMCTEYEDIYSQLVPFRASTKSLNVQGSDTKTESIIKGVTNTTNKMLGKSQTHGTAIAKTHTDSIGGNAGFKISDIVSMGGSYSHAYGRSQSENNAETKTESSGTAESLTEQNSVAKALTSTTGEALQLNYENRAVKTLLDHIDEQIKRMRSCEDFGLFDTCAYFVSKDYDTAVSAASVFKSLTRGESSSIEASAVNIWDNPEDVMHIKEYLMRFYHPEFVTVIDKEHKYVTTPTMLISSKELAYQMPLPKKSVVGIPVVECAEFGREVVSFTEKEGEIALGNIYHMHHEENKRVNLGANSLTAHTFITGSTGSGKSTTVYKILDELVSYCSGNSEDKVKFMVIEPAKGEYKNALAKNRKYNIQVYGTNPNITKLLRINPFRFPSDKIHIYEHLDKLTEIFNVCWPMYAAMPAVLKAAMENAYRNAGWNLVKSENKYGNVYPSFLDIALEVEKYINKSEYSDENKSNYKGSLLTRLESLTNGINSMIFTADDIDDKELFDRNVIVDLSRVGSTETKALIMGILVLKLQEYRIANSKESNAELRHVTVLEEAHNLLKRTSAEQSSETSNLLGKSVEMIANSIAEMRTYGEGFIIADQSPGLLDMSVIRNTNTKIIMRLPDFSDRELVGKAAGLNDDQIIELAKLPCGVAAVSQNDWISPVLCKIKKPKLKEVDFIQQTEYPVELKQDVIFDLLDSKFRTTLDDLTMEENFRKTVLKSSIPTGNKVKILEFLKGKDSVEYIKRFASIFFDYFENSREILEKSKEEISPDDLKMFIVSELSPSVIEYSDEQINLLITLMIEEYRVRYHVDYPIWREFASYVVRGII